MSDQTQHIDVLFVALGNSRVGWYRCVLPAMYLGCDWMGVVGVPPDLQFLTGYVQGGTKAARFEDYDLIVVQQPRGRQWATVIRNLRAAGKVVLYEIDDYVHGIRKARDHDFRQWFQPQDLRDMELCMRMADGLLCSTEYIARRYRSFNPRTFVCENGLDLGRYRLTRPPRGKVGDDESVTIMWSGATGHHFGFEPWMHVVERVMRKYPHVCFASIGQDFASRLGEFGERVISIPFAALETYPAAMTLGDIALAPAGKTSWYRGKSDLRAMEAAALGIPVIADRHYERAVLEGHTGFVIDHPGDALERLELLVEDAQLRCDMGDMARAHAARTFDMRHRREQWRDALIDAWESRAR